MNTNGIGKRFKQLRSTSGIKQKQMAEYLHVDQSFISKIEKNERELNVELLEKSAQLFGCPIEVFFDESYEYQPCEIAFRAQNLTGEDLESVAQINRIASNLRFMEHMLEGE